MQKLAKAKIRTASTALILLFSILAALLLNGSFGWLASRENVDANGMNVKMRGSVNVTAVIESFGVTKIETVDANTVYTFDTEKQNSDLPLHDPNGIGYDEYMKAIVIRLTLTAHEALSIRTLIKADGPITTSNVNYVSNAIMLSTASESSGDSVIKGALSESFAEITTVDGATVTNKKAEINFGSANRLEIGADETVELYFIMEYNEDFISYINAILMADSMASKVVNYSNDITFIIEKA